jgi:branched-chain amino acid transport system substrate-binding protein
VADGVGFDPDTVRATGFTAELDQLVAGVEALVEQAGDPDNVGVLFIAFELAPDLLEKAMDFPILTQVKWVGSDGTAGSGAVLENEVAAEFAEMVNWLNPIFGIDRSNERWQRVNDELREILGRNPESYTFNMYDQVWVVTLSLLAAGEYDTAKIKAVFPTVADNFLGASGWTRLNEAGDRVSSDYDLWAVREVSPGTYDWEIVGVWVFATGQITWFE